MAELSLYLTNVNVSLGQSLDMEKSATAGKAFEAVELGELGQVQKQKTPRRVIHFASGETMEEYSTDEEEEEEQEDKQAKKALPVPAEPSKLTWGPFFWFYMWRAATSTVSACDYLGERMASLFGITSPKYQYAIDEYYRMKKEEEEEEEESRLSEEAERRLEERPGHQTTTEQPEGSTSFVNVTFEIEKEPRPISAISDANSVPVSVST